MPSACLAKGGFYKVETAFLHKKRSIRENRPFEICE